VRNIVFINTHPIQYFAPLYQEMAQDPDIRLSVIYLSDETRDGYRDSEFGVDVRWDVPLLSGYDSVFIPNNSWKSGLKNGFFGLVNFGVIRELGRYGKDTVAVIHGWSHFSLMLSIWAAWFFRLRVCLRGETPLKHELFKTSFRSWPRKFFLRTMVFPFVDSFLYIGTQNKKFYQSHGIPDRKLRFTPYSVDNARFRRTFLELQPKRDSLRTTLGIPTDSLVVLYSGKYIAKKRPMDLLIALASLRDVPVFLVMVGEGELRPVMEEFINENKLHRNTLLTGFINQSSIGEYYTVADLFVMCSEQGETWGLSVNEAMNFNLPLLVSDLTGCAEDLVKPGLNGYTFTTGITEEIAEEIRRIAGMLPHERAKLGQCSAEIVKDYSFQCIIAELKTPGAAGARLSHR
jgi:glycosyltransferase involved in cell wall biosynthesis